MPKQTGVGAKLTITDADGNTVDISNDVASYTISDTQAELDATGIDDLVDESLGGRSAGTVTLQLRFNTALSRNVFRYGKNVQRTVVRTLYDATGATVETYTNTMIHFGFGFSHAANGELARTVTLHSAPGAHGVYS